MEKVIAIIDLKSFYASCECACRHLDIFTTPLVCVDPYRSENSVEVTLTYCFEKPGVLRDADDDSSVIREINEASFARLKSEGIVSGGMLPKLENAFASLRGGVSEVVITHWSDLRHERGTVIRL